MSRFLAPIHTWLFNKIKLQESLEVSLIEAFKEKYGKEVENIFDTMSNKYGSPLEERPIEDLIDVSNIHGWLQNRIIMAETRYAASLTEIFNKYGSEAEELALKVHNKVGTEWGKDAEEKYELTSAPEIHQALNNYILDGMPCDNVNNITAKADERLEWKNVQCLHRGYWESVKANVELFYNLRAELIKAFVSNANKDFVYNVETNDINGNMGFVHEIIKK